MKTREIASKEFEKRKGTFLCDDAVAWHIWKRSFDVAYELLNPIQCEHTPKYDMVTGGDKCTKCGKLIGV